jgi:choline kinase
MITTRAIVLAAGRGSRLGNLTEALPKCLLPVSGRPLLEWQMDALRSAGVTMIGVVRGYRAGDVNARGVTFFDNPRWSESNMVRSLMCAADWLRAEPCIISYADIVYSRGVVEALNAADGDLVITYDVNWLDLWSRRFDDPLSDAETFVADASGQLVEIGGKAKSLADIRGQYMGLLKFSPSGWATIEDHLATKSPAEIDRLDMTSLLRQLLAKGVRIAAAPVTEPWFEIDSARDLAVCEAHLSKR